MLRRAASRGSPSVPERSDGSRITPATFPSHSRPASRWASDDAAGVCGPWAALAQSHGCSLAWYQSTTRARTRNSRPGSGSIQFPRDRPSPVAVTVPACRYPRRSASTRAIVPNAAEVLRVPARRRVRADQGLGLASAFSLAPVADEVRGRSW